MVPPGPDLEAARSIVERAAIEAGRDPATVGMEGRVSWRGDREQVANEVVKWADAGASHVSINTMGAGFETVDDHLAALSEIAEVVQHVS